MKSQTFDIYLHNKHIDTVFFDEDMTAEEVKRSLINHDGYHPKIVVRKAASNHDKP